MGRPVEYVDVAASVEQFGALATLVTVTATGTPHLGSVLVAAIDDHLHVRVGPRASENVRANAMVTLTWVDAVLGYQLIVDGVARTEPEPGADGLHPMVIAVERGILHRLAGRNDAGPTCLALPMRPGGTGSSDSTASDRRAISG